MFDGRVFKSLPDSWLGLVIGSSLVAVVIASAVVMVPQLFGIEVHASVAAAVGAAGGAAFAAKWRREGA